MFGMGHRGRVSEVVGKVVSGSDCCSPYSNVLGLTLQYWRRTDGK